MTDFTQHWKNDAWEHDLGHSLTHAASSLFRDRGIREGDRVFIITIKKEKLFVGGRLVVQKLTTQEGAEKALGHELWEARDHILAREPLDVLRNVVVPDEITSRLRFVPNNALTYVSPGVLDPQTLRGVRRLTHESATLLNDVLSKGNTTDKDVEADLEEQTIRQRTDIGLADRLNLIAARRGQGLYRDNVRDVESFCRITGLAAPDHIRASHIKPWCKCTDAEKLDGSNGLFLSPHIFHLFDRGYISFSDAGDLVVSELLAADVLTSWVIELPDNVGPFNTKQRRYLKYHRCEVFQGISGVTK